MSNITVAKQPPTVPALAMNEGELIDVLQSSVYPGAKLESIKLVIGACRASGKDPLKKPYHIVPMSVKTGRKKANGYDETEMRDVIMPGINDYRTDASRTGQHAGTSEPEFGSDRTETLGGVSVTYPEWCRVTVKRLMPGGQIVEFSAVERWKENYATAGRDNDAPNAMWRRRPYAQLAKCAEAQALRKGFPEVGNQPTADEMEGKEIDMGAAEVVSQATNRPEPKFYGDEAFAANLPTWRKYIEAGKKTADDIIAMISTKAMLTEEQQAAIRAPFPPAHIDDDGVIDADFVTAMEMGGQA
jgi:phage recombination protein Bet